MDLLLKNQPPCGFSRRVAFVAAAGLRVPEQKRRKLLTRGVLRSSMNFMPQTFTLVDKAYYVAQYLEELGEIGALPPRTVCERYAHVSPGAMGLEITAKDIVSWASDILEAIASGRQNRQGR